MRKLKIRVELDDSITEEEVIIRCRELTPEIVGLQKAISEQGEKFSLSFFKDNIEYFFSIDSILFFETSDRSVDAHTASDVFQIKYKLYELENLLPKSFIRVSKSTILNVSRIYSIDKNITSSSLVSFEGTHKQIYVSRSYFKALKKRLDEIL